MPYLSCNRIIHKIQQKIKLVRCAFSRELLFAFLVTRYLAALTPLELLVWLRITLNSFSFCFPYPMLSTRMFPCVKLQLALYSREFFCKYIQVHLRDSPPVRDSPFQANHVREVTNSQNASTLSLCVYVWMMYVWMYACMYV